MSFYLDRSSQYLYTTTLPVTAPPFTIAFWVRVDDITGLRCMMYLGDKDTTNQYYRLDWSGARPRYKINDSSETLLNVGSNQTANVWHHCAVAEYATNDRYFWWNGGTVSHNSTSKSISGVDSLSLGVNFDTCNTFLGGYIMDLAIWNIGLDSVEDDMLADGISPLKIQPGSLVAYYPLVTDAHNWVVSGFFTDIGSPSSSTVSPNLYRNYSPIPSMYPVTTVTDTFRPAYSINSSIVLSNIL